MKEILPEKEIYMEESILYQSHPVMFKNNPIGFIFCIILIPLFGFGLLIFLIWWLKTLGVTLTVTDERVTLREGLLSKHTNDVYHTDIRNVQISQGLLQRIFNVGKISISSAGHSGIEIEVVGLPDPQEIKDLIDQHRRREN